MLAAKFYDDIYYNNAYYAKVPMSALYCSCLRYINSQVAFADSSEHGRLVAFPATR